MIQCLTPVNSPMNIHSTTLTEWQSCQENSERLSKQTIIGQLQQLLSEVVSSTQLQINMWASMTKTVTHKTTTQGMELNVYQKVVKRKEEPIQKPLFPLAPCDQIKNKQEPVRNSC